MRITLTHAHAIGHSRPHMGNRLSKIITRTGDTGTTGLGDGSRVAKDSARIEAIGAVDELNSAIGLLRATPALPADLATCLLRIQHDLFDLGGELADPRPHGRDRRAGRCAGGAGESFNGRLPPLKEFILPGGGEAAARCHVARTWRAAPSDAAGRSRAARA